MAIKFNKENKVVESKTKTTGKLCSITLVIQIILTVILAMIATAPFLSGFAGIFLALILIVPAVFLTGVTAGTIWISKGVQNFFKSGFKLVGNILDGTGDIIPFFQTNLRIVTISIPIFVVSLIGFIYNLIYFLKHEKANKGRFIASCIFLVVALINLILGLVFYLTAK